MQQVLPNAQNVFADAENKLDNTNISGVQIDFSAASGRMSFGTSGDTLRTDEGIFTQAFFNDTTSTGDVLKAAAVTELHNNRFATSEQNASAITQSLDFILKGVSQLATDDDDTSAEAKVEAANAMYLSTSLQAFSNSIPAEFGSAPGDKYTSSFNVQLQNKGVDLGTNDTVRFLTAEVKQPILLLTLLQASHLQLAQLCRYIEYSG